MENRKEQNQNIEALRNKWRNQKTQPQNLNSNEQLPFGITENEKTALKLCLIDRTGKRTYIPYAFQPVFIFDPASHLTIKTSLFSIQVKGRGLDSLCDYLANDTLLWIRENAERIDDHANSIFIEEIEFEGLLSEE